MRLTDDQIDTLVAGLAKTRDDDLDPADESPRAASLFEQIVSTPMHTPVGAADRHQARAPRRLRRRRIAAFAGVGALVVLAGGGATATVLFSSEDQATADIECYQVASVSARSVVQEPATGRDPITFCREELARRGQPVPRLVACAGKGTVAVIPGRTSAACTRAGFAPLGAGYDRYRARVARLEDAVLRLESRVVCLPPAELAARVQQLLDSTGWDGWTTRLRSRSPGYPCGSVTTRGGGIERTLAGAIDGNARVVFVHSDWSRAVDDLLYGAPNGVFLPLQRRSGTACFTTPQLRALVDRAVSPAGLRTRVVTTQLDPDASIEGPRGARYDAGCSIIAMLQPAREPGILDLTIYRRR